MVVKGRFSVQLVEAESKIPFKEHTDDHGKHYAEVEPEANYFIQVQFRKGDGEAAFSPVVANFFVDGASLGYRWNQDREDMFHRGLWGRKDGIDIDRSLTFERSEPSLASSEGAGSIQAGAEMVMGSVCVKFFEGIEGRIVNYKDVTPKDVSAEAASQSTGGGLSKMVRSGMGTISRSQKPAKNKKPVQATRKELYFRLSRFTIALPLGLSMPVF